MYSALMSTSFPLIFLACSLKKTFTVKFDFVPVFNFEDLADLSNLNCMLIH